MLTKYTYSVTQDFPGGKINLSTFQDVVKLSIITFSHIDVLGGDIFQNVLTGGTIDIWFTDALTSGEKSTLDGDAANPAGGLIATSNSTPSPGPITYLNAYLSTTQDAFNVPTTVNLDAVRIEDPPSVFSLSNNEIVVGASAGAAYRVAYDVSADNGGGSRTKANWWLELDVGDGFAEVAGTRRGTYHRNNPQGEGSASAAIHLRLNAGNKLRLRGDGISGGSVKPMADGVSLIIEKIGD